MSAAAAQPNASEPNAASAVNRAALADRLGRRLDELRAELVEGRRALAALDARRDDMVAALLRVEGAAQVLEELRGPATAT